MLKVFDISKGAKQMTFCVCSYVWETEGENKYLHINQALFLEPYVLFSLIFMSVQFLLLFVICKLATVLMSSSFLIANSINTIQDL